jgi:hypothetical protein
MENKKLFKYLLKDLSELEEMFTEKDRNSFDELEMEFIQNRVLGAKKLVQMYLERENALPAGSKTDSSVQNKCELDQLDFSGGKTGIWIEEVKTVIKPAEKTTEITEEVKSPGVVISESAPEIVIEETAPEIVDKKVTDIKIEDVVQVNENRFSEPEIATVNEVKIEEQQAEETPTQAKSRPVAIQQELQLDDEEPAEVQHKRLGDLFSKEKSVNDLLSDSSKLESKFSNRPVDSLQSAIGINDRFQYIRELFEGSADNFVKTVAELDSMDDIKDAVNYLQSNFKWKKNETSLKFVNLIKRRFPHE